MWIPKVRELSGTADRDHRQFIDESSSDRGTDNIIPCINWVMVFGGTSSGEGGAVVISKQNAVKGCQYSIGGMGRGEFRAEA